MSTFAQAFIIILLTFITLCVWKIMYVVAETGRIIIKTIRFVMEITEISNESN
jgi:hypothetical protein